jgi:hypothetical protein
MLNRIALLITTLLFCACAEVKVSVIHEPPSVVINEPSEGSTFLVGESVLFSGTARSASEDLTDLTHVWVSSNEEVCPITPVPDDGKPTCVIKFAEAGEQTVTVTVTDPQSDIGTASVTVNIMENAAPTITILSPTDGEVFTPDELISIQAQVDDLEDPSHLLDVTVESSIDGQLPLSVTPGTDGFITDSTYLTAGTHYLTYTVADKLENTASQAITVVVNSPPSAPVVEITPDEPGTGDSLTATLTTESVDPEGDSFAYLYEWTRNGSDYPNPTFPSTNSSIGAGVISAGDYWTVKVYADDGNSLSEYGFDDVNVSNQAPSISGCSIVPGAPQSADDLLAVPSGWVDPDGQPESYSYRWYVYDTSSSGWVDASNTAATMSANNTTVGAQYQVECTPDDGITTGATVTSAPVTVGNSIPSINACLISPSSPSVSDPLVASPIGEYDYDGDLISYAFVWSVNGAEVANETSDTLPVGNYVQGDTVEVECTPNDGTDSGYPESDAVTVINGAPSAPVVSIVPGNPVTNDGLTVSLDTPSVDPDGDAITYNYSWAKDGVTYSPTGATDEIAANVAVRGEAWTVSVTATDGSSTSPSGDDSVTIGNAPPSITSCDVTPASPAITDDLVASASGGSDPEGDAINISYTWWIDFADGAGFIDVGVNSDTLNSALTAQTYLIRVTCTPDDGVDTGTPVDSSDIGMGNSAPSIASCDLAPSSPTTGEDLTAGYSGYTDPNGDPENMVYTWYLNGTEDTSVSGDTYPSANTQRGDNIYVTCEPYDGTLYGTVVSSSTSTVVNSPPDAPSVHIEPTSPTSSETLSAVIDTAAIDPDGDAVTYEYEWVINASVVGTNDTLDYSQTTRGDVVVLTVFACDNSGDCSLVGGSSNVTVGNSPPELADCPITPTYPYTSADLTANPSNEYDEDGDGITYTYVWYVDNGTGFVDAGFYTDTVPGSNVLEDSLWYVECTPNDGTEDGATATSQSVLVGNAPPTLSDCTLSPAAPYTTNDVIAVPTGGSDPDGDPVTYEFTWYVNGIEDASQTSNTYPNASTSKDDIISADCFPTDGVAVGQAVQAASVTVLNSAPGLATVEITPAAPITSDSLTASVLVDAVDPDGDAVTYTYEWTKDSGASGITSQTVSYTNTIRGEIWAVLVTACDSDLTNPMCGTEATDSVTIDNALPTISSCGISPQAPTTGQDLDATPNNWYDADGDLQAVLYDWEIDSGSGFTSLGIPDPTLDSVNTTKGVTVRAVCTPYDSFGTSAPVYSSSLTIENSLPSLASCDLLTTTPDSDADLSLVVGQWTDNDPGDTPVNRFEWYINGQLDATQTGQTYPASSTTRADEIYARCYAGDGTDEASPLQTAAAVVANSAPSAPIVSLIPSSPTTTDQIDINILTPSVDPDVGDAIQLYYTWTKNSAATPYTGDAIPSSETAKGEIWTVFILACDDYAIDTRCASTEATASVTVINSAPMLTSVILDPTSPTSLEDISSSQSGGYDADGDYITYSIKWYHDQMDGNGFVIDPTEVSPTFPYTKTKRGDFVKAEYTPIDIPDGASGSPVQSAHATVVNSPPSQPTAYITPSSPDEGEDLVCNFSGSSDADGDPVIYDIAWFEASLGQSAVITATLPTINTTLGEQWHCEVTPNDPLVSGPTGVSSFVDIVDGAAPDAPIIDPIDTHRNDTDLQFTGTCEAACSLTMHCSDNYHGSWTESNTCSGSGTFNHTLGVALSPGNPTMCYATCSDSSLNESGASNQIVTEACLIPDLYEDDFGDGDSPAAAIDNWTTMPDNNTVTAVIEGNLLQENLVWDSDWYRFDTIDDPTTDTTNGRNTFDFKVDLLQGAGTYSFLVYRGGYDVTTDLNCPTLINSGYTDYNYFAQDKGDGSHVPPADTSECGPFGDAGHNLCEDLGSVFYVEVLRDATAPPSCQHYEIAITNGAP